MAETIAARVKRLEQGQASYAEMLHQSAQLTESLDLLILSAGSLSESLLTVERQQAQILNLQHEVATVKESYSSKAEVVAAKDEVRKDVAIAKDDAQRAARGRMRWFVFGMLGILLLGLASAYLQQAEADDRCHAHTRETEVLVGILQDFARTAKIGSHTDSPLNRGIENLRHSETNCAAGFHLPTP